MSVKCMARVWELSEQKGSKLLLLLAIADFADDNGFAWPGIDTLATKIRMSSRQTMRLVQQLDTSKELVAIQRRARGNLYIVTVGLTPDQIAASVERAQEFGAESDKLTELESDNMALLQGDKVTSWHNKVTSVTQQSDIAMSPEPSLTINKPSSIAAKPQRESRPPGLSEGQRYFLQAFGAKRFRTNIQKDAVLELEKQHGTAKLKEGVDWAATIGMTMGRAVVSLQKALQDWGNKGKATVKVRGV